jgi:acyl-CoA thioester hydrolase
MTKPKSIKGFTWTRHVYWQDTDAGGIVYHPNYLNFAQHARSEFMREFVCLEHECAKKFGIQLVVRHAEIDYKASARLDDTITTGVEIAKLGNSSMVIHQDIKRGDTLLATVKVTLVAINAHWKAVRIPPQLRQIFEA